MNEQRLDVAFEQLRRQSLSSLLLMLVGTAFVVGSIWYAATRLRPLEAQLADKREQVRKLTAEEAAHRAQVQALATEEAAHRAEVRKLTAEETAQRARIAELQRDYATLKANAEKLYAVRVTPENEVYELKATAQATGSRSGNRPEYRFWIYVQSPPQTRESIASVAYRFDHPTFRNKVMTADDPGERFAVAYHGWGCLSRVGVTVALKDGTRHAFDFDMCRSLGPGWGGTDRASPDAAPAKLARMPATKGGFDPVVAGALSRALESSMPVKRAPHIVTDGDADDGD